MISDYSCPICNAHDWKPVQEYVYSVTDHSSHSLIGNDRVINLTHLLSGFVRSLFFAAPSPKRIREWLLNSYERLRRQVLFEVWLPGENEVTITSHYCQCCGFMGYSPRPDESDIANKYQYLGRSARPDELSEYNAFRNTDPYSKRNREQIFHLVMDGLKQQKIRLLDCGGASGWYVEPFARNGHDCDLVDYETEQLPGVRKVGNSIHEIQGHEIYDAIVCRAVLEHLADPLRVVKTFHTLLKAEGLVYAMVPCEIHAGIDRLGYDPVTHINFFTPHSFGELFRRAQFEVIDSGADEMSNIWVLARKRGDDREISDVPMDIDTYLYPGRLDTVGTYILNRLKLRRIR